MLDTLIDELQVKHQDHNEAYESLVARLAMDDGENPKAATVAKILADAGRDPENLRADVAEKQRRIRLREQVDQRPSLEAQLSDVQQRAAAMQRLAAAAMAKHNAEMQTFLDRADALRQAIQSARNADSELRQTAPKAIRDEQRRIDSLLTTAAGLLNTLRAEHDAGVGHADEIDRLSSEVSRLTALSRKLGEAAIRP